jgi:hypothetical protein
MTTNQLTILKDINGGTFTINKHNNSETYTQDMEFLEGEGYVIKGRYSITGKTAKLLKEMRFL